MDQNYIQLCQFLVNLVRKAMPPNIPFYQGGHLHYLNVKMEHV